MQGKELIDLNIVAMILVIIGAINWGLIGFFQWDLVAAIFGGQAAVVSRIIYALVGLAGFPVSNTEGISDPARMNTLIKRNMKQKRT
jgi:uncharacterized membrane protein YuzA (DUF378 family)